MNYYNELVDICNDNGYKDTDLNAIDKAYQFALKQHQGMKRKNGDDYITHPLKVAIICAKLNVDPETIITALVHETILHGNSNYDEIGELFGEDVKELVVSLAKVNTLHLHDDSESSSLYLRKVLVALSKDVRVIILKLAGRVHNLETKEGLDHDLQIQKAKETWNVLIPIAHRLGINELKSVLEDLSFQILKPDVYNEIESSLPLPREELDSLLEDTLDTIKEALYEKDLKFEIKGRVKSIPSLNNKLSNGKKWSEIYDVLGIRIICEELSDCYLIIGLIHSLFRPIPKRFKDYIAMPKGNSYQSLHTGVLASTGFPIEIQVRTKEMNEIAEHGLASHWSYKEKSSKNIQNVMEQKLQMFRNIIEANSDEITDDDAFISNVSNELLADSIYVYTPKGDVVELPYDATPIDFAYRIHSKVGETTTGALVNDKIVTLDYRLKDNDVVMILTTPNSEPKKDWLNFVKTLSAKSKIKAYFSKKDRADYIERGKELLERELRRQKISIVDALNQEHLEKLYHDLKVSSLEEIYLNIGSMRYTPIYIVNLLYEDKTNVKDLLLDKILSNNNHSKINYKNDIVVSGYNDILVTLASCCKPVYGDEIVGYITKGQGISVHKKDCLNIKDVESRIIDVSWNETDLDNKLYLAKLSVYTNGINVNMLDIITKASQKNVTISSINELNRYNNEYYDILVKVKDKDALSGFIEALTSLDFVTEVKRY